MKYPPCGHHEFRSECPLCRKFRDDARYAALLDGQDGMPNGRPVGRGVCRHFVDRVIDRRGRCCKAAWVYECDLLGTCTAGEKVTGTPHCPTCVWHHPEDGDVADPIPLILQHHLSPGDVLVMSGAIESLHATYPGQYLTGVETSCDAIYEHNPLVSKRDSPGLRDARRIKMEYPLIHRSDQRPVHFLQGFCEWLGEQLGRPVPLTVNRPRVYLAPEEIGWLPQVQEITKQQVRYWLVNAGTKDDYTAKWWGRANYQRVVDLLRGRMQFVQIGEAGHQHPALDGVIDLRGKTDTRQLIRLVYHSSGVLCGVTLLMHLAAAMQKPAVVLAGGREPRAWNSYPRQTYLSAVGMLPCCADRGCWRSRTVALGDGSEQDRSLCDRPIGWPEPIPACMGMFTPEEVAAAIGKYCVH